MTRKKSKTSHLLPDRTKKKEDWISGRGKSKGFKISGSVKVRMLQASHGIVQSEGRRIKKGEVVSVSKTVADVLEKYKVGKRVKRRK